MALVSLLLVLALERIVAKNQFWRSDVYLEKYAAMLRTKSWWSESSESQDDPGKKEKKLGWQLYVMLLLPAAVVWSIQINVGSFWQLILGTAVLMIGVGCPNIRSSFKGYLQAANRGDLEACDLYSQQLGYDPSTGRTFGQHVVWVNYVHYMAVALWFIALGAAGVVLYSVVRHFAKTLNEEGHPFAQEVNFFWHVLDWIPVRLATLGFLLVGDFSKGVGVWMRFLGDSKAGSQQVIAEVAKAAEVVEADKHDCTEEPCTMLRLAKRNVMLMLVVVAVLTLGGWMA